MNNLTALQRLINASEKGVHDKEQSSATRTFNTLIDMIEQYAKQTGDRVYSYTTCDSGGMSTELTAMLEKKGITVLMKTQRDRDIYTLSW